MYIWNSILDAIINHPKLKVEYGGCHAPHNETPLYGRNAYWRLSIEGSNFFSKVTTPVKCMEPKPETLKRLLRAELKRRIESIHEAVETDHYGKIYVVSRDPHSIRGILQLVEGEYLDLINRLYPESAETNPEFDKSVGE